MSECTHKKAVTRKLRVLFLCTGNSCRSQMAEGFAKAMKAKTLEAYSAGTTPHDLNPRAVRAMAEADVDISGHRSKHWHELKHIDFDYVITVCNHAHETCPVFPGGARVLHVGFDDPPALARNATSEEHAMSHYRRVRDEIKALIATIEQMIPRLRDLNDRNRLEQSHTFDQ